MKRSAFLGLFSISLFLLLPVFAFADTPVSGTISSDTTWSPAGGVYIIDSSFSVATGTTLTIEPGTIIKAKTTYYGGPSIYGKIEALGTKDLPIYFTSINDDVGGDTNGDGPSTGADGKWQGLYFRPGSTGDFDYVNISYAGVGGYDYGDFIGIENDGGTINIQHSNIHDNYSTLYDSSTDHSYNIGTNIYNKNNGTLSISDSTIANDPSGISSESGNVTISNTTFQNNGGGIDIRGSDSLTLTNDIFTNNSKTAYVEASINFTHSGNISNDISEKGFQIGGTINQDTVWDSKDLPIIINSGITVPAGKTLTVDPGTVIKIDGDGYIDIAGNLIAKGTTDSKIYFTSKKDDSVGGDTNGDGAATTPSPRDWSSFFFDDGSKIYFDNVVVSYGGFREYSGYLPGVAAAIYDRGADFSMTNSFIGHNGGDAIFKDAGTANISNTEITDNTEGIQSRGGSITISQSSLHGNQDQAIYNQSGSIIDAKNNWWGSADGPNDTSTSTPTGSGDRVSANVSYVPFLTAPPGSTPPPQTINPVIIIPGIMGSDYRDGKLVIDPILHTYDDLIATLKANGYIEGKDLFTFPYEWRDSNVLNANLLKDKIDEVKSICGCSKVDLVAHSMGGLVAREYIESGQYQNDVDHLIFLGTPQKGAPEAYLEWEAGEFGPGTRNTLIKEFFRVQALENGYASLFSYIHNRPISSVQELLPTFDYLKDKSTGILITYPNDYPRNIFIESLNTNTGMQKLLNSGIKITNIIGNSGPTSTISVIRVASSSNPLWINGKPDGFDNSNSDRGLEKGSGDGTVTVSGATLDTSIPNEEWDGVSHLDLPRETEARVFNLLTGKIASTTIFLTPIEKILSIQLQSPVDMVVVAPDGKRMGKNFVTGEEYNEIPGAFYSGYQSSEEYITIPNPLDGDYKIQLQGTGSGKYTVVTNYIDNATSTTAEIVGTTTPNQINNVDLTFSNANPEAISADPDVISDINKSYDLGWIKDKKTRDSLVKEAQFIIKFEKKIDIIQERLPSGSKRQRKVERIEKSVDRVLAKSIKKELDNLLKKKLITQQAYNLLKDDLDWLINN